MITSVILSIIMAVVVRYCAPLACIGAAASLSRDFTFGDYFSRMKGNGYVNSMFERIVIYAMMFNTVVMCWFIGVWWFNGLMIDIACFLVLTAKCVLQKQTALAFAWCYTSKRSSAGTANMRGVRYSNGNSMYRNNSMYGRNSMYGNGMNNQYGYNNYNQQYAMQYGQQYGNQFANPLAYRNLPIDPQTGLPIENPSRLVDGYRRFKDIKKKISDRIEVLNTPEEEKDLVKDNSDKGEDKEEVLQKVAGETAVFNEAGVDRPVDKINEYGEKEAKKINERFKQMVEQEPDRVMINGEEAVVVTKSSDAYIFKKNGNIIYTDKAGNDVVVKPRDFSEELHAAVFDEEQIAKIQVELENDIDNNGRVSMEQPLKDVSMPLTFHCIDTISGDYMPNAFPEVLGFNPVGVYTFGEATVTVFAGGNVDQFLVGYDYRTIYVIIQLYMVNNDNEKFRILHNHYTIPHKMLSLCQIADVPNVGKGVKFTIEGKPIINKEAVGVYGFDPVNNTIDLGLDPDEISAEIQATYLEPDEEARKEIRDEIVAEKKGEIEPKQRKSRKLSKNEKKAYHREQMKKKQQNRKQSRTEDNQSDEEVKKDNAITKEQLAYAFCSYPDEFKVTGGFSLDQLNSIVSMISSKKEFNKDKTVSLSDKELKVKYEAWLSKRSTDNDDSDSYIEALLKESSEAKDEQVLKADVVSLHDLSGSKDKSGIEDLLRSNSK